MSGAIAMGTNKITGLGDPTANQDAATKVYVDTADALKLSLTGGTMSGAIAMGTSKITGLGDPTANQDAATKVYVDGILGSATSAAASAATATTQATNAAASASTATTQASNASTSASSALTYLNNFKGQYYGSLSSDPALDPLGNAVGIGDLYWNSTVSQIRVYNGSAWEAAYLPASGYVQKTGDTMTGSLSVVAGLDILGNSSAGGALKVYEDTDNGSNYVGFRAPSSIASNLLWILPSADGIENEVLKTDGAGNLSWGTGGGGGAGNAYAWFVC